MNSEFAELKKRISEQGLLASSSFFYARRISIILILVAISAVVLIATQNIWIQMANAMLLAFTFGQLGLFIHDVGHGQVITGQWHKATCMILNVMFGSNVNWWIHKHNRHHAFPNQHGYDPDIDIRFLAFSEDQARKKRGWYRILARHQHFFFIPLLLGEVWHLRYMGIAYAFQQKTASAVVDIFLIAAHLALYIGFLFLFLPPGIALAFLVVHSGLLGIYLGLIFAPNHKGMMIMERNNMLDYLHTQILTSRNVRGGWIVDMLYGGLNYQIEHHLFPSMPRNKLKRAAPIVEEFCKQKNIPYHAVGVRESFRQIFGYLQRVGRTASLV